ncbi:hypothetical protein BDF14DRAFT_1835113 [Spinellus fusiger]|nr:hypothetical protein BDF14DRAFT_1835113 [Spinellus fusiger]
MLFFVFVLCYYTNWLDLNAAIVGSTFGTIAWIDTAHEYITVYYMCFIAVYTRL